VLLIKHLLYDLRFSIEGAKKRISELRRQGELSEARKVRVQVDVANFEDAKRELRELLDFCTTTEH
jgi:hypothetical protein